MTCLANCDGSPAMLNDLSSHHLNRLSPLIMNIPSTRNVMSFRSPPFVRSGCMSIRIVYPNCINIDIWFEIILCELVVEFLEPCMAIFSYCYTTPAILDHHALSLIYWCDCTIVAITLTSHVHTWHSNPVWGIDPCEFGVWCMTFRIIDPNGCNVRWLVEMGWIQFVIEFLEVAVTIRCDRDWSPVSCDDHFLCICKWNAFLVMDVTKSSQVMSFHFNPLVIRAWFSSWLWSNNF